MERVLAVFLAALAAAALTAAPASSKERLSHGEAREMLAKGEIVSLKSVLKKAKKIHPGKLIEAELESRDGRIVYHVEIVGVGGRVWETNFDGKSGELISEENED